MSSALICAIAMIVGIIIYSLAIYWAMYTPETKGQQAGAFNLVVFVGLIFLITAGWFVGSVLQTDRRTKNILWLLFGAVVLIYTFLTFYMIQTTTRE